MQRSSKSLTLLIAVGVVLHFIVQPAESDSVPQPTLRERLTGFLVAAHRGSSRRADGNTIHGLEKALAARVDIIEIDLRLTRDGIPVVYHDESTNIATKGCNGVIADMTLADIEPCRVGRAYPIPTFEEVLQWAHGRVVINAEFKTPDVIESAIALVQKYDAHEWVYFQTKSDPALYRRARTADTRVALLFKPVDDAALDWALGLGDELLIVIELDGNMVRPDVVARIHAAGKLASRNAWRSTPFMEAARDACGKVYDDRIDIAVTRQPCECAEEAAARNH